MADDLVDVDEPGRLVDGEQIRESLFYLQPLLVDWNKDARILQLRVVNCVLLQQRREQDTQLRLVLLNDAGNVEQLLWILQTVKFVHKLDDTRIVKLLLARRDVLESFTNLVSAVSRFPLLHFLVRGDCGDSLGSYSLCTGLDGQMTETRKYFEVGRVDLRLVK